VNPNTGAFPNNVTFSCSRLPALSTCSFQPNQVGSGAGDSLVTLNISTTAAIPRTMQASFSILMLAFPLTAGVWFTRRQKLVRTLVGILAFLLTFLFVSCGGGLQGGGGGGTGSPGTPAGTYPITITATSGSVTHTAPISLTVTP